MYSKLAAVEAVTDFINLLKNAGIEIKEAFLFGSYASDTPDQNSDIDVAIISPDFNGFRFDDLGKIAPYKILSNPDIEVHTFSKSDFNPENPFVKEIISTGLKVA